MLVVYGIEAACKAGANKATPGRKVDSFFRIIDPVLEIVRRAEVASKARRA